MTTPENQNNEQAQVAAATTKVRGPYDSFGTYFRKVQKNLFPDLRMASTTTSQIDDMTKTICRLLSTEAHELAKKENRVTLLPRDIEFACRFLFPEDLAEQAIKVGRDAVDNSMNYTN